MLETLASVIFTVSFVASSEMFPPDASFSTVSNPEPSVYDEPLYGRVIVVEPFLLHFRFDLLTAIVVSKLIEPVQ